MLALLEPDQVESFSAANRTPQAQLCAAEESYPVAFQKLPCYDEFGNDELDTLRHTVADLQQQVASLQSQLQKQRRGKGAK
jgi:hypothetical protein